MPDENTLIYAWAAVANTLGVPDWKLILLNWPVFLSTAAAAYLLGSIPFGLVLTRLAGKGDIRAIGSGNIGATNVLRTGSKPLAAITLLLDGGKGLVATALAYRFGGPDLEFFAALTVVIGHMFPIWLGFRGGKGVATAIGVLIALSWLTGFAAILVWLATAAVFRYSSLAALVALGLAPIYGSLSFLGAPRIGGIALLLAILVYARHAGNIRRLVRGEEPRIKLRSN